MLEGFDPNTIEDEAVRKLVVYMMNQLESQHAQLQEKDEVIQSLRDEISRLKGEQGKPKIKANKPTTALSSEKERRESKPRHKESKQAQIRIDRVEVVKVDHQELPKDAKFKGYEEAVVQDIEIRLENIKFRKEKYYSPSHRQTYQADLPPGYKGQFGPRVRAWVLTLYYEGGMSEPKILEFLQTVGMRISAGQLSDMLIKDQEAFHAESAQVLRAGLISSPWQHLDSTATRVNGRNEHCHVLCNLLYTAYCTRPSKDRITMLRVLLGGADPVFRCNELALDLLKKLGLAQKWCKKLTDLLPKEQDWEENQLDQWLDRNLPQLGPLQRKLVKDALAIAAYRTQTLWPVVELLVCDDASQFNWLTAALALCWIHEFRHYKKLIPCIPIHCQILDTFNESFWQLYRSLLAYRHNPSQQNAEARRSEFEQLFGQTTGYELLDKRLALTLAKKEALLLVLSHPEILLHNNPAELGARQRVRKRDVSLQARTEDGIRAWDTFQTLVATAKKLGVNIYQYFYDRIAQTNRSPSLVDIIEQRSQDVPLGASWGCVT
jgi:Transposase IS66 family